MHLALSAIPTISDSTSSEGSVVAAALGGAIGVEREIRDREAGIRTHLLVALGSGLFTIVSAYGFHAFLASGDASCGPTRPGSRRRSSRASASSAPGRSSAKACRSGADHRGLPVGLRRDRDGAGAGWYAAAIATTVLTIFASGRCGSSPSASSSGSSRRSTA